MFENARIPQHCSGDPGHYQKTGWEDRSINTEKESAKLPLFTDTTVFINNLRGPTGKAFSEKRDFWPSNQMQDI